MGYLELVKVRPLFGIAAEKRRRADKIVAVKKERRVTARGLPVEVTKAQLTLAQVSKRILQMEGRKDELILFVAISWGSPRSNHGRDTAELPGARKTGSEANLIAMAGRSNTRLMAAGNRT